MANKQGSTVSPGGNQATLAEVTKILDYIEWYCRYARLLLEQLDKATPIKLTRELKAMIKKQPSLPRGIEC